MFLDIILPGMNGFNALRLIRKNPATQHIPVIMISGNEHATEQFYANRIGADDFMKKPFSRFEIFARIENLLDASQMPPGARWPDDSMAPRPVLRLVFGWCELVLDLAFSFFRFQSHRACPAKCWLPCS